MNARKACSAWNGPLFSIAAALAVAGAVHAQSPIGTVSNIPQPDNNAFSTSLRYDSNGDLYAWDGLSVWEQSGGTGGFANIGAVAPGNSADAGPIAFSQDGKTLLLSNGAGGFVGGSYNGVFWTMPASGGATTQVAGGGIPYTFDAVALPVATTIPGSGAKYIVYEGNSSYSGASLSIFDSSAGTSQVIIDNGPGATTLIAVNPQNESIYVGIGYGADAGEIYSFSLSQIDSAYESGTPLNFLAAGTLFDPAGSGYQSGAGMFFDSNGYLFSGGGGVTVFRPNGTICYNQPAGSDYFDALTYNPAKNEVFKVPYGSSTGSLYSAADFEPATGGTWSSAAGGSWANAANWSTATVPSAGTVTFAGSRSSQITVTIDNNQAAAALVFDVAGSNGYTLSQGVNGMLTLGSPAGASIAVVSGTQSISAPIVLAGSLAVSTSAGGFLCISGNLSQAAGASAALSLSGDGQLILSGTDDYTGGTIVSGGTLCVANSGALPAGYALTIGAGGVVSFDPAEIAAGPLAISSQAVAAVPEPGTLMLAATLLWTAAIYRRFQRFGGRSRFVASAVIANNDTKPHGGNTKRR